MTEWHRTFDGLAWRSHAQLPLRPPYDSQGMLRNPANRVLVTGSRTWPFEQHVQDALGFYWELGGPLTVVHGDALNGADRMARRWCDRMNGGELGPMVEHEPHPADWSQGKGAGFDRNGRMVNLGADVCLAFADVCRKPNCRRKPHPSHGVWDCANRAKAAGIEVVRYQTWEPPR